MRKWDWRLVLGRISFFTPRLTKPLFYSTRFTKGGDSPYEFEKVNPQNLIRKNYISIAEGIVFLYTPE